jgi:hypothetical protein
LKIILTLRKGLEENLKDCDDPEDVDIIHIELYLLKRYIFDFDKHEGKIPFRSNFSYLNQNFGWGSKKG